MTREFNPPSRGLSNQPLGGSRPVDIKAFQKGRAQPTKRTEQTYQQRAEASTQIGEFRHKMEISGTWGEVTKEDLVKISKLVKITGRRGVVYGGPNHTRFGTAGSLLDEMSHSLRARLAKNGELPDITPAAPTAQAMAKKLALYTGGSYTWKYPMTWTTSLGEKHRDPSDHVEYVSQVSFEDAWSSLSRVSEGVSYKDHLESPRTALKFGKYLLERASTISTIGSRPRERFLISVRTIAAIKHLT